MSRDLDGFARMHITDKRVSILFQRGVLLRVIAKKALNFFRRRYSIHADVDYCGPGLDETGPDHSSPANGGNQYVGFSRDRRKVLRSRMANRHSRMSMQQEHRNGQTNDSTAADHNGARSLQLDVIAIEEFDDAGW